MQGLIECKLKHSSVVSIFHSRRGSRSSFEEVEISSELATLRQWRGGGEITEMHIPPPGRGEMRASAERHFLINRVLSEPPQLLSKEEKYRMLRVSDPGRGWKIFISALEVLLSWSRNEDCN